MKRLLIFTLLGASLLVATFARVHGQDKKPILTEVQVSEFLGADAKFLNEALANEKIDKKLARKLQATVAMMIAYCDINGPPRSKSYYENILDRINNSDWNGAKELALPLKPESAKTPKVDKIKVKEDIVHLMYFFSSEKVGGFGVEMELGKYDDQKEKISDTQFDRLSELSFKMAVIAKDAERFGPEKDKGAATKKNWNAFATDMRETSLSLAAAAKAKNENETRQLLKKLDSACTNCHDVFR